MMYDRYIMRRTQIYLDDEQDRALADRAKATGRTKSNLIRQAIDAYLAHPGPAEQELAEFRAAVDAAFGVAPHLEDGATYVSGVRAGDRRRQARQDEQWRR